jgi:heme-degrading monooxygenase HmoA
MSSVAKASTREHDAQRIAKDLIVRIWHGRTRLDRAESYAAFLDARALPDYHATPGNLGAWVLRRDATDAAHFLTVSYWESEAAIRAFAGDEPLKAKYYPEDADFLLEFEPEVVHYHLLTKKLTAVAVAAVVIE